jgi:ZIP family zinc transporter
VSTGHDLLRVAISTPLPVATATAGGAIAAWRPPSDRIRSGIQHFAGGLVFATAATELVPDLTREHSAPAVIVGFTLGIAAMLAVATLPQRLLAGRADSALPELVAITIDVFLDGVLIGIGFVEGGSAGLLLTVALTVELAFLGLTVATATQRHQTSPTRVVATTAAVASAIVVGGVLGVLAFGRLRGAGLSVVLSFGTVALLYLVTEELLAEAHEQPDTPVLTAMFFVGFLVLLLVSFAT